MAWNEQSSVPPDDSHHCSYAQFLLLKATPYSALLVWLTISNCAVNSQEGRVIKRPCRTKSLLPGWVWILPSVMKQAAAGNRKKANGKAYRSVGRAGYSMQLNKNSFLFSNSGEKWRLENQNDKSSLEDSRTHGIKVLIFSWKIEKKKKCIHW